MTAKAAKDAAAAKKAEEDESDEEDDDMSKATESQPQFAAMSLELQALKADRENERKAQYANEIAAAVKRGAITPAYAEKLKTNHVTPYRMSLASGKPERLAIDEILDHIRELPNGAAWKSEDRLRMATESAPPDFAVEEIDDSRAQEIADEVLHKPKRKAMATA
jgi:hypothetical protein